MSKSKRQVKFDWQANNYYRTDVLIGNWFEDRISGSTDKHAITPCIPSQSDTVKAESVLKSDFKTPIPKYDPKGTLDFINWRLDGYSNILKFRDTNIKLYDGLQFERNLTTTTDILYRIEKDKHAEGMPLTAQHRAQRRKLDLLNSYGNQTQTGLILHKKCMAMKAAKEPVDVSITHYNYKPKTVKLEPPFKPKKCEESMASRQLEFIREQINKPQFCKNAMEKLQHEQKKPFIC